MPETPLTSGLFEHIGGDLAAIPGRSLGLDDDHAEEPVADLADSAERTPWL